jgi:hypothetical protein
LTKEWIKPIVFLKCPFALPLVIVSSSRLYNLLQIP